MTFMILRLFSTNPNQTLIDALYARIVAVARDPRLFETYRIADTLEGRFESLSLFLILMVRQLQSRPAPGPDLAQDMTDRFFAEIDSTLRETGVGDVTLPKRINRLAEHYLGRANVYGEALREQDSEKLASALARNIELAPGDAASLAAFTLSLDTRLSPLDLEALYACDYSATECLQ
jgi:cytochrome b pre-mRNA-processing protein 3